MLTVFISHSTADREFVEADVITPLSEAGIGTWYSKDSIRSADDFNESIRTGLEKSTGWLLYFPIGQFFPNGFEPRCSGRLRTDRVGSFLF